MPGIYTKDQFAQLLAQAIENANNRRQASLDRSAARTESNAAALANFGKALGRTYETWQADEERLAKLQQEREEAIKEQQEHDQELRTMFHHVEEPTYGNEYSQAMLNKDMAGYVPVSARVVPNYNEMMKRRGLY